MRIFSKADSEMMPKLVNSFTQQQLRQQRTSLAFYLYICFLLPCEKTSRKLSWRCNPYAKISILLEKKRVLYIERAMAGGRIFLACLFTSARHTLADSVYRTWTCSLRFALFVFPSYRLLSSCRNFPSKTMLHQLISLHMLAAATHLES